MARTTSSADENSELASLYSSVGGRVKQMRTALGLTQEQLSDRSGVSRRYIVQIERIGLNLTLDILHQLATALGVKTQDLINRAPLDYSEDELKLHTQKMQFKGILASIESFVQQQSSNLDAAPVKDKPGHKTAGKGNLQH